MTANLTIGRPRLVAVEPQARSSKRAPAELQAAPGQLGDADAEVFDQVGAAYKLPRATDAEKAARPSAIQAALQAAARRAARNGPGVRGGDRAGRRSRADPERGGDLRRAGRALLAQAALDSAALNVEINLASMTDPSQKERLSGDLARAQGGVGERVARVLEVGRSRFPKS